jgi:methionyl-tRNA synthetase
VRLTNPAKWGMRYGGQDQVIFTYTALFSFSLYCAELLTRRRGLRVNPFDPSSGFTNVAAFGIDNAVPYLVGVLGSAIELGDVKPFDYYLTNYFYYFEGAKFSTSRVHLAYASDLVAAGVSPDALRYFLTKINPETERKSFVASEFLSVNNDELAGGMERTLMAALALARQAAPTEPPAGIVEQLARELALQASHLRLPATNMARGLASVDTWVRGWREVPAHPANAYWWLKGFVMLAAPFLPSVGQSIWSALGHDGPPKASEFFEMPALPHVAVRGHFFAAVSSDAVEQNVFRAGLRGAAKT